MSPRLPTFFRSLRSLQAINTAAVSAALSSATTVVLGTMGDSSGAMGNAFFVVGLTTLSACVAWMKLLRMRATVGQSKVRLGWVLSIPIAAANAAVSAGIMLGASESMGGFLAGLFYGATFGAIIWIPALLCTLTAFGLPIAWAQRKADEGLAGEERGERIIGLSAFVIASIALAQAITLHRPEPVTYPHWYTPLSPIGYALLLLTAAVGVGGGLFSLVSATLREAQRRRFVEGAEAGQIKGYRVEPTPEGKVLLRVAVDEPDYRVGDIDEEELFALDQQGQARKAIEPAGLLARGDRPAPPLRHEIKYNPAGR